MSTTAFRVPEMIPHYVSATSRWRRATFRIERVSFSPGTGAAYGAPALAHFASNTARTQAEARRVIPLRGDTRRLGMQRREFHLRCGTKRRRSLSRFAGIRARNFRLLRDTPFSGSGVVVLLRRWQLGRVGTFRRAVPARTLSCSSRHRRGFPGPRSRGFTLR